MSVLNLLTKLSPRRCKEEVYIKSGTNTGISGSDVAAALNGLTEGPIFLAYLYASGLDAECERKLCHCLAMDLHRVANAQGWKKRNDENFLRRMSSAAITECLITKEHCLACKGTGITIATLCERCGGAGRQPLARSELAKMIGVSKNNWKKRYEAQYIEAKHLLAEYERLLIKKLHQAFSDKIEKK